VGEVDDAVDGLGFNDDSLTVLKDEAKPIDDSSANERLVAERGDESWYGADIADVHGTQVQRCRHA
jgi:hypothetical protein